MDMGSIDIKGSFSLFKQFKVSLKEKEWLIVMVLIGIKMIGIE